MSTVDKTHDLDMSDALDDAVRGVQHGDPVQGPTVKIPYPGDPNPIEIAVWAAEFVRVRSEYRGTEGPADEGVVDAAVREANHAVDDLRRARERS